MNSFNLGLNKECKKTFRRTAVKQYYGFLPFVFYIMCLQFQLLQPLSSIAIELSTYIYIFIYLLRNTSALFCYI